MSLHALVLWSTNYRAPDTGPCSLLPARINPLSSNVNIPACMDAGVDECSGHGLGHMHLCTTRIISCLFPIFLPTYLGCRMRAPWMTSCRAPDLSQQSFPFTRVSPLSSFGHVLTHQATVVDQQSVSDLALYAQPPAWVDLLSGHGLVPMPPRSTDSATRTNMPTNVDLLTAHTGARTDQHLGSGIGHAFPPTCWGHHTV